MNFVRSKFGTNEPLPVERFFPFAVCAQQTGQKVRKKCSTGRGSFVTKLLLTKFIL